MKRQRLNQIFEETESQWEGDNAFQGLQILSKYTNKLINGADHDIIFSCDIDDVIETITEDDAIALAKLNWIIEEDSYFACFV